MVIQNILIVDDEEDVREFLRSFLEKEIAPRVTVAPSGKEALAQIKKEKFNLILLDINMPGLSGIDVIKETLRISPQTKILVISAYDSQEIADTAIKAGAHDYITKPLAAEAIAIKIRNLFDIP